MWQAMARRSLCCVARVDGERDCGRIVGKRWAKRWTSSGKGHRRNDVHALRVTPPSSTEPVQWSLPPSKSHLIRALLLASQSLESVELHNVGCAGEDARAMRRCLQQLGVHIEDVDQEGELLHQVNPVHFEHHPDSVKWIVHGVGDSGFKRPASVLNAGNSGTTLRLLAPHAAMIGGPVMLDGDGSLRKRSSSELWATIEQSGATLSIGMGEERLPALIDGPMNPTQLEAGLALDVSRSSQPVSSWILAAPTVPCQTEITLEGTQVSSRHSALSLQMLSMFGGEASMEENQLVITPSPLKGLNEYTVPGDASMAAFAMLACTVSNRDIDLIGWPTQKDAIGHEILEEHAPSLGFNWNQSTLSRIEANKPVELDLKDANDLLPPLAAILGLNKGGRLKGAAHAAFKESNRLQRTADVLAQFGMTSEVNSDGLTVQGGQRPQRPDKPVETYGDHRLFMTAVLLASACGGDVVGQSLHMVADEPFIDRLIASGVGVEQITMPPIED